jgi:hypothetical protein
VFEVADIFRRFADAYLAAHGAAMLPSHRRAISSQFTPRPMSGRAGESAGGIHLQLLQETWTTL